MHLAPASCAAAPPPCLTSSRTPTSRARKLCRRQGLPRRHEQVNVCKTKRALYDVLAWQQADAARARVCQTYSSPTSRLKCSSSTCARSSASWRDTHALHERLDTRLSRVSCLFLPMHAVSRAMSSPLAKWLVSSSARTWRSITEDSSADCAGDLDVHAEKGAAPRCSTSGKGPSVPRTPCSSVFSQGNAEANRQPQGSCLLRGQRDGTGAR